jgi:hypothetical protein
MLNVSVKTDTELVTVVFGVENSISNLFHYCLRLAYVAQEFQMEGPILWSS